ncbi:methyl-accepting chemotaxis protein [Desulfoscipio sp. XC116]|uniref:methyl-accepting chemotaxis protein n=1 Tax=Desulfoscipio sp. XC116 TaxID=3144975 RepID=UPI00325BDA8B
MKLGNLKIAVRLGMGFGLVIALMISLLIVSVSQLKQINDKMEHIVNDNNVQVKLANEMLDSVHVVSRVIRSIALLDDVSAKQSEKQRIDEAWTQYDAAEKKIAQIINDEGKVILEKTKGYKEESRVIDDSIIEMAMLENSDNKVIINELLNTSAPRVTQWRDSLRELIEYAEGRNQMRYEEALQAYTWARIRMFALSGFAIFLGIIIALAFARSVTSPVANLVQAANSAAAGDLTVDIKVKTKDEIGVLAAAFSKMISQTRQIVMEITDKANTVASSSQQLNSSAQETAASANETSATMTEISTTVEQVGANIQEVSALSEAAAEHAGEGSKGIERVIEQMRSIADMAGAVSISIDGLNQKSQEINQIVELITNIADQTNLLALNAAIEAARAGEQGRGFAVVAEEVRKLAEQSSNAAKEIYTLINAIQFESQKAVESMASGGKEVEAGTRVVGEAGANFKEIIGSVQELTSQIQGVASAAEQMSAGVQNVAATTEEQTAAMEEVSASAESLTQLSEELNALVGRFKV